MNETIKLTLIKPLIIESVKNETFQKGKFDKSVDQKAVTAAYVEQAGNEAYHERILQRSLYTSLEELKTHLSDYLSSNGGSTGTNDISTTESGDNIILSLVVSDRFNKGYTDSLARLSSKYIEESMLMDWWRPVNEKQSAIYANFVERDLAAIKRCFNKTAPTAPTVPYTTVLNTTGSSVCIGIGEESTITYSISAGAIDDIEVRIADKVLIDAGRTDEGFTIIGKQYGHTFIELYSRHNPEITRAVHVYVTDQS